MSDFDYNMTVFQDDNSDAASAALTRIRNKQNKHEEIVQESEIISKINREREFLQEFTESEMNTKIESDTFFYEVLFAKVEDSTVAQEAIANMISSQVSFYETLNTAPIMNHISMRELTNSSKTENTEKAQSIIEAFMRTNLFALTTEQKATRYKDDVMILAEQYVAEHDASHELSMDLAYKTVVTEHLIKHIHSSAYIDLYYEDCLTSDHYKQFFNLDVLVESKKVYDDSVRVVSQLVATSL